MDDARVARALTRAETALADGRGLGDTGFWSAVASVRRRPEAAERYADRIGAIDREAFERAVRARVPAWAGLGVLAAGTGAGVAAVGLAPRLDGVGEALVFLAGLGLLDVSTHSLAHWAVGRALGMRFTHCFLGGSPPPRPGVKVDYATYLRVPPRRRALMHASGAVVTKLVPFALLPFAPSQGVRVVLTAVGVLQIVTDVLFSARTSDWKKVRRELRAARSSSRTRP